MGSSTEIPGTVRREGPAEDLGTESEGGLKISIKATNNILQQEIPKQEESIYMGQEQGGILRLHREVPPWQIFKLAKIIMGASALVIVVFTTLTLFMPEITENHDQKYYVDKIIDISQYILLLVLGLYFGTKERKGG